MLLVTVWTTIYANFFVAAVDGSVITTSTAVNTEVTAVKFAADDVSLSSSSSAGCTGTNCTITGRKHNCCRNISNMSQNKIGTADTTQQHVKREQQQQHDKQLVRRSRQQNVNHEVLSLPQSCATFPSVSSTVYHHTTTTQDVTFQNKSYKRLENNNSSSTGTGSSSSISYGLRCGQMWSQPTPVEVEFVNGAGGVQWVRVPYDTVTLSSSSSSAATTGLSAQLPAGGSEPKQKVPPQETRAAAIKVAIASATISVPGTNGSIRMTVTDYYGPLPPLTKVATTNKSFSGFSLNRTVTVRMAVDIDMTDTAPAPSAQERQGQAAQSKGSVVETASRRTSASATSAVPSQPPSPPAFSTRFSLCRTSAAVPTAMHVATEEPEPEPEQQSQLQYSQSQHSQSQHSQSSRSQHLHSHSQSSSPQSHVQLPDSLQRPPHRLSPDSPPRQMGQVELFVPGIAYRDSARVAPAHALLSNLNASISLVREDRIPVPLAAMREPTANGAVAYLRHVQPNGSTFVGEDFVERIIDARMQFGSLGFIAAASASRRSQNRARKNFVYTDTGAAARNRSRVYSNPDLGLGLVFQFPGSEGDRTYICCNSSWANRSHPLVPNVPHSYTLEFGTLTTSLSYAKAVHSVWRRAFDDSSSETQSRQPVQAAAAADKDPPLKLLLSPPPPPPPPLSPPLQTTLPVVDQERVYRVSADLLASLGVSYNGVPVVPFRAALPSGTVDDTSSEIGFVGKATLAAALLLHDAVITRPNATRAAQAIAVIDVWVERAMTASGIPKSWFNTVAGGNVYWRRDSAHLGHLRIISEGAAGILRAYQLTRPRRPKWLAFARALGDFLVEHQAPDGSIAGAWAWNGTQLANFTNVSDHPIPLLLALYNVTEDIRYRYAAERAGNYSRAHMNATYHYLGGACDNPNVLDKEAGALALRAFLLLHKATGELHWLDAAAQAADYTATWTYLWDAHVPANDPAAVYPSVRTTLGVSLIATGQSGADNYMASCVHDYWALGRALNDSYYIRFARFLERATRQVMDWDGALGYGAPGLMNEAIGLAPPRGHGVDKWLPWLTVAVLDPMIEIERETGGNHSLPTTTRGHLSV
eukprot:UC1_evm1s1570